MIDQFAKEHLHSDLRDVRETMLWKLEGVGEYDARRPLTSTGTNLLGLIKHLTITEAWYFGEVFERPFPERLPGGDEDADRGADMWATEDEARVEIVERYKRVWEHSDATITALDIDAPGHVPWWPRTDSSVFAPPPSSWRRSTTTVRSPARWRYAARHRPLWPAPITTAS